MLIYEVNLRVDSDAAEEMATWLREHIRDMLAFDGFEEARWYLLDPEAGKQRWTVHYLVRDYKSLQAYFDQHAERMRQEGLTRFDGKFSADRRVLYEREVFSM